MSKFISKIAFAKILGAGLGCAVVNVPSAQRNRWAFVSRMHSAHGISLEAWFGKLPASAGSHSMLIEYWYCFSWPEAERLIETYWPPNIDRINAQERLSRKSFSQPIAMVGITNDVRRFRHPSTCSIGEKNSEPMAMLAEIADDVKVVAETNLFELCEPQLLALTLVNAQSDLNVTALPVRVAAALACANLKSDLIKFAQAEMERLQTRLPDTLSALTLYGRYFDALIESVGESNPHVSH